jgi:2,4-dienoyl-CoA reductase-like NADH-dependent reductase (Old Yellow Enzyme family)
MKAALSESLATGDGVPDAKLNNLYTRWAHGGYGLVVTGNVMVDRRHMGEPGNVVVESDEHREALTRWAKTTKDGGSAIWMQLNHPGRQANPIMSLEGAVAPSAIGVDLPGVPAPRALAEDEIHSIIERFAVAAVVAESSGFDGVQVHAAHGYLVSQFLSPLSNTRTDDWGGSVEHRARFAIEIVRRIRQKVSPSFAVGIKLNSADFQRGGFSEDESRTVVRLLADESLDLIEVSGGSYESPAMIGRPASLPSSTRKREAYFLEYAETVRTIAPHIPIAVTGGFRSRAAMVEAVSTGACDVVGLGRPATAHPDAANQILSARTDRIETVHTMFNLPGRLSSHPRIRAFEGFVDMQWHLDQMHRMAATKDPDVTRSKWLAAFNAIKHHGIDALRRRRGLTSSPAAE